MPVRSLSLIRALLPAGLIAVVSLLLLACSSGGSAETQSPRAGGISIATVTPVVIETGGKPATQPSPPSSTTTSTSSTVTPSAGSTRTATAAPTSGKWIDVDVTRFQVRLMDGTQAIQTISPVAVGAQINSGAYESTQTGLFHVYNKIAGLQYDAPYQAYISDWVAFDPQKDNGFHSFLLDEAGKVVDPATGKVSNGCIRTGASKTIFDFAEVGMAVYVHL